MTFVPHSYIYITMAEAGCLYRSLRASPACNAYHNQALEYDFSLYSNSRKRPRDLAVPALLQDILCSHHKTTTHATKDRVLRPCSSEPLSAETRVDLTQLLDTLNAIILRDIAVTVLETQSKDTV
jgi:hypothetical protein